MENERKSNENKTDKNDYKSEKKSVLNEYDLKKKKNSDKSDYNSEKFSDKNDYKLEKWIDSNDYKLEKKPDKNDYKSEKKTNQNYYKSQKKSDINDYKPELALIDDISQINNIIVSFWGKNSKYDNRFYYRVLKHNLSYVYKIENEIIAVCLVEKFEREKEIDIALLCVKKAYQRNGLGKSLLNFCINNCIKKGYYVFFLHVATTNFIAINLYKKLGFYAVKYVPNYYHNDPPPDNNAYLLKLEKGGNNQEDTNIKPIEQKLATNKRQIDIEKEENIFIFFFATHLPNTSQ